MPVPVVKSYASKYNIPMSEVEQIWKESLELSENEYGDPYKNPKTNKSKNKNKKIYATTMNIFKNKMKKHYGIKENLIYSFHEFLELKS